MPALLDAGSAVFGAAYFLLSAKNVKRVPICLLLVLMFVHTWAINAVIAKASDPTVKMFSFDTTVGCLGFLNWNQPLLNLFLYWLMASFFGSAGYTLSLLFYSPLVTCNAYLIEPLIAQTLGYLAGLDKLPGLMTAVGTVFAIYGIMYIDKGSRER
jgi:hypothetical protein